MQYLFCVFIKFNIVRILTKSLFIVLINDVLKFLIMEQLSDFNATMDRFYQLFLELIDESIASNKESESTDIY